MDAVPRECVDTAAARPAVTVRPARADELDAAGEVVRAAYAADNLGHAEYHSLLANARDRALDAELVVAVDTSDRVLGSVTFALPGSRWAQISTDGEAEFRMLGVAPDARGHGVGSALIEWCLDRAGTVGCHRVVISSEQRMHTAHRLYTRRGFTRRPDLDWSPLAGVDLLGFELDLTLGSRHAPC